MHAQITSARYYAEPTSTLRGIELSISPGEFVVITGPAASGKSTLCYCLTGVIPHSISADLEGDVVVAGRRLRDLRLPEVAPLLGFVMQGLSPSHPPRYRDRSVAKKRSFAEAVRAVVRDLGRGQVVSYGEVARRAGYPRAARAVGNVLATNLGLPWWRVVRANGELAAHSGEEQARRLRREGISVRDGRCQLPPYSKGRRSRPSP